MSSAHPTKNPLTERVEHPQVAEGWRGKEVKNKRQTGKRGESLSTRGERKGEEGLD